HLFEQWAGLGRHGTEAVSGSTDCPSPSFVGNDLQSDCVVDDLVSYRRDDLPSLCLAPAAGSYRTLMGWHSDREFLVGSATQFHSAHPQLALRHLALLCIPARCDGNGGDFRRERGPAA